MLKKTLLAASLMAMSMGASAQLAGKNVVLVHGFQPGTLGDAPANNAAVRANGADYWSAYWADRAEARIDWDSTERVEGEIMAFAYEQLVDISQSGLCAQGCIFVTHSTGDLVARYLLENKDRWLAADGHAPVNVLSVIDYAGAGGGTELADIALQVAHNDSIAMWPMKAAVEAVMGVEITPTNLGVLTDLQPVNARNLATANNAIPRLRFVGGGTEYAGVSKPFIKGSDDSVVPMHSACGAISAGAYDSCVSNRQTDGKVTSVSAPSSLRYNHYPVLMGESINHSETINNASGNEMTYAMNGFSVDGLNVDFATETKYKRAWYQWWGRGDKYKLVVGAKNNSMSGLTYNTLNQ